MCRVLGDLIAQLFDLKADLGVLHHALDAVEVGEVADRLVGVVQHSSDSLRNKQAVTQLFDLQFPRLSSFTVFTLVGAGERQCG